MATDPQDRIAFLALAIPRLTAILDSGITQTLENNRMVRLDLKTIREQLNGYAAEYAALTVQPRQIRRFLPIQYGKGL